MHDELYCCKLRGEVAEADAATELLEAQEFEFSSWENREEGTVFFTVYAESETEGRANCERLAALLPTWRACGVALGLPEYFRLPREDWAEVWKQFFPILHLSKRIVIKPSWLDYTAKAGEAVVELDPGMSFGTGQHATTAFCLRVIDELAGRPGIKKMLDAGCGSGILAIAAAKLGFETVDAFDFDPDAVRIAGENLERNALSPQAVRLTVDDAATYAPPAGRYDFVAANILGHLLIEYRHNIVSWVRPGGFLALAGILATEFDRVTDAFTALGLAELDRRTEKEWTGGLFQIS